MNTKYLPLDLKALRAEARRPAEIPDDPNVFTTSEYMAQNGLTRWSATKDLNRLLALGKVERATKLMIFSGSVLPSRVAAWRIVTAPAKPKAK